MHGRRTALRYSPSTPSPAGARSHGRSTVLPFGSGVARSIAAWRAGGGAWGGEASIARVIKRHFGDTDTVGIKSSGRRQQ